MSLSPQQLTELTIALEVRLLDALTEAVYKLTPDPSDRLLLAGGVATLLMRHYTRAQKDPETWLTAAVTAIIQP